LESGKGTLSQELGSRQVIERLSMIHWAHAFCVAARPSLNLSLLHAANTRRPLYAAAP
jgi:hypothetical protein